MGISVEKFYLEGPRSQCSASSTGNVRIEREPACRKDVSDRVIARRRRGCGLT
jgi:hypothetical protein